MACEITPPPGGVGQTHRRGRSLLPVVSYALALIAGTTAVGTAAGAIGSVIGQATSSMEWIALLGILALAYGLHEFQLLRLPMPQARWQVPAAWARYGKVVQAALYGAVLGAEVFTFIPYAAFYVLLLAQVSVGPAGGATLGFVYGAMRALSTASAVYVSHSRRQDVNTLARHVMWAQEFFHQANGLVLVTVGADPASCDYRGSSVNGVISVSTRILHPVVRSILLPLILLLLVVGCSDRVTSRSMGTALPRGGAAGQSAAGFPADVALDPSPSASWALLNARPLRLPVIPSGTPCPVVQGVQVDPAYARAFGAGPVFGVLPALGTSSVIVYDAPGTGYVDGGGWYRLKTLWIASPSYHAEALIRGHQIDGPGMLEFTAGSAPPAPALQFATETGVASAGTQRGWRDRPSETLVRSPGCYAFQVDGFNFSEVIVFEARQ